ncbi:MAG: carbonic anhydrase family protein [Chitinophagales bacterium]
MITLNKDIQDNITPSKALELLKEGNQRFLNKKQENRDLNKQVDLTGGGQFPYAVVLSCIDSRVPVEHVLDQGIGDIFSTRVAGNIVNEDVLGSIEYSCKVAGSKLVLVMGHTKCGAVTAACKGVELGNITALLSKIKPAVKTINPSEKEFDDKLIEDVSIQNVKDSIENIKKQSPILKEMDDKNEIDIVGAIYDVNSGFVTFMD